jgi:hypothetical protein
MSPDSRLRPSRSRLSAALLALAILALAGCSGLVEGQPTPTPLDFGGIAVALARVGIAVSGTTSGDAGCPNPALVPTAIRFDATGLDQPSATRLRVYIFANHAAWDRLRADVDTCVAAWAGTPETIETVDISPYVIAGSGPWPAGFKAAVLDAVKAAAGNGG